MFIYFLFSANLKLGSGEFAMGQLYRINFNFEVLQFTRHQKIKRKISLGVHVIWLYEQSDENTYSTQVMIIPQNLSWKFVLERINTRWTHFGGCGLALLVVASKFEV